MTASQGEGDVVAGVAPDASAAAVAVFGSALPPARRYADLLASDGVAHGHVGPREVARLWDRHLVNCAVVGELLPRDAQVLDVGSGAGLPGLPLAIVRPDIRIALLEPMQRRVDFLVRAVAELGLDDRVEVVRGRADDVDVRDRLRSDWIVARAVAPLERLVRWCVPLLSPGGTLLAMKGRSAADEAARARPLVGRRGARIEGIETVGSGDVATQVVRIRRVARGKEPS